MDLQHESTWGNCGGSTFTWGELAHDLSFLADTVGIAPRLLANRQRLKARRCDTCGNVQLFVKE